MKTLLQYIVIALACLAAGTATSRGADHAVMADSAYNDLAYSRALELYKQAADSAGASTHLYYNIGNTYYRLGDLGRAVLWYERALQLDPSNKDARANLEFVNTRITDRPVDDRSLVTRIYDNVTNSAHPDTWAWVTFGLFALTVAAFVGYLMTRQVMVRKTCFFGGAALLVLTILSLSVALTGSSRASNHNRGIITVPSAQLSTAPRAAVDANSQAFLLHEGTKVEIVDSVMPSQPGTGEAWYEVKIGNARAWINARDIERI